MARRERDIVPGIAAVAFNGVNGGGGFVNDPAGVGIRENGDDLVREPRDGFVIAVLIIDPNLEAVAFEGFAVRLVGERIVALQFGKLGLVQDFCGRGSERFRRSLLPKNNTLGEGREAA